VGCVFAQTNLSIRVENHIRNLVPSEVVGGGVNPLCLEKREDWLRSKTAWGKKCD